MRFPFQQIDVFTSKPFFGNPVAVILNAAGLTPEQMQRIANWTNLSETTFVLPPTDPEADYRLRIFDPHHEMPFAGHPTLGSAFAVLHAGCRPLQAGVMVQECAVGRVRIHIKGEAERLALELPQARLSSLTPAAQVALRAALCLPVGPILHAQPISVGPTWITAELADAQAVIGLQPDMQAVAALSTSLEVTGVTVFGRYPAGHASQYEVRSFAPALGIAEDPVCGSGNGCVAALLQSRGQRSFYVASQGQCLGRQGRVEVDFRDDGIILIGGQAVLCIEGTLST